MKTSLYYKEARRRKKMKCPNRLAILLILACITSCQGRRGALVRDGMNSRGSSERDPASNVDPDVHAITTRCSKWNFDPINAECIDSSVRSQVQEILSSDIQTKPMEVFFRKKQLSGKRQGWMRATASLNKSPVRAVWACSSPETDASMTYDDISAKSGTAIKRKVGSNVLEDSYEDCLKRVYGKYVELEVLLPKTKATANARVPPSLVYTVPIKTGNVNPQGMVSKSRATVTLYPNGRTLLTDAELRSGKSVPKDEGIRLGLTNVHVPLGSSLVDPSWVKGRKIFWKGRSVGLV